MAPHAQTPAAHAAPLPFAAPTATPAPAAPTAPRGALDWDQALGVVPARLGGNWYLLDLPGAAPLDRVLAEVARTHLTGALAIAARRDGRPLRRPYWLVVEDGLVVGRGYRLAGALAHTAVPASAPGTLLAILALPAILVGVLARVVARLADGIEVRISGAASATDRAAFALAARLRVGR